MSPPRQWPRGLLPVGNSGKPDVADTARLARGARPALANALASSPPDTVRSLVHERQGPRASGSLTRLGAPLLRIGELSRRLGVSDHVLRAWENRYGLLQPVRSPGGFRLYSEADEWRIRRMQAYLADGLSAAEAARAALGSERVLTPSRPPTGSAPR